MTYQIEVFTKKQKYLFKALTSVWVCVNVVFFVWWFQKEHILHPILFVINTVFLVWTYLLPAYFFFFVNRMKQPNPRLKIPTNLRVAIVVTKAPSEPFELIRKTLKGTISQKYPHDNWIADEDPTPEIISWANKHNVKISSRKGIVEYNQKSWPKRTKCKEGNLTYFYDKFGYKSYDIVVQLDADHVPQENYLEEMLRPFADKKVGYVSAPSICSQNADKSWSARARLYAEGLLHGAQQAGHSNGFAPLCFGSHYAIRTKALKQIGGLGPELAEDHSTTMIMNANGWKGVHAINAIALGDGPATFADAMTQEFQWSRSLMNLLLMWTPKYLKKLPLRLKIEFIFAQLWYPLYSSIMLLGLFIPIFTIITNTPMVSVSFTQFFVLNFINVSITLTIMIYLKSLKLLRPFNAKIISWEIIAFQLSRWPWTLLGVISSIYDFFTKSEFAFKVTPKDRVDYIPLPNKILIPYILIICIYLLVGYIWHQSNNVTGYYYFIITGLIMYGFTLGTIIFMHEKEQRL
jgi:cellulose synthase (UDP-forming)